MPRYALAVEDGMLSAVNDRAEIIFLSGKAAVGSCLETPLALKSQLSPPPVWSTCTP